ncbi:MAG: beta-glucosidase [Candidatus Raymondbacteria bacterium RifOxyA12_full_50_37]|nr:MAG: beta-glucosidase [Candidatus Raymondbacteria bacterium RifOxyA12_full_50_37]OGJ91201.1 MAG: beta-glucosidase [Candidatus Raymondbacteria bacterium RIFOXYA2_FULL_49_16]OGJ95382.1 MAG: beta-glucosidase [Candidatus Raymondbacteria bacterium RifOxyC12_full_50_8]OGJ97599.1 MAG: beta-glucosidase [Candidatus Raymondbacteria bacterium RIFOXYC2_FULL_50_21]OGJ99240.1 MAG: beta-glucosidase [Candidatus Raymondbacteria bacterium RifOxyB12_full_50_8]OGP44428.1 MAG: beta-glucosidase [Candidatus Raymo
MSFSKNFIWGVAAASYQIEGAANEDGKGLSVWDAFCKKPGKIYKGHTGDIACDHYHRYKEDIALMKEIGIQAYRLSLSWPRILSEGIGKVNTKGIDFYKRLIDELRAAGITPYVTLFHWDYPLDLYAKGGWLRKESSDWFAEYATTVAKQLGDHVSNWMTFNEPAVFTCIGHQIGEHAPGDKLEFPQLFTIIHNVNLSHGKAVQALRAHAQKSSIGSALAMEFRVPYNEDPATLKAMNGNFGVDTLTNIFSHHYWAAPIVKGAYPEQLWSTMKLEALRPSADEMKTIAQPIDFLGLNIYSAEPTTLNSKGELEETRVPAGHPLTGIDWLVLPSALYYGPKFIYDTYKLPIYITENGMSNRDIVSLDGKVHDPQRIDFLTRYLKELKRAQKDGAEILGYFQWSVMDNFEWAKGYKERFGLIFVDYCTQKRILKDSAHWYRTVIEQNGANL